MITWVSFRQAVLVTVFLSYLLNFTLQWQARKSKHERTSERIHKVHFQVFLFGLSSLLCANLLQSGILECLICWAILVSLSIVHYVNFREKMEPRVRSIASLVFYFLIGMLNVVSAIHYILPS